MLKAKNTSLTQTYLYRSYPKRRHHDRKYPSRIQHGTVTLHFPNTRTHTTTDEHNTIELPMTRNTCHNPPVSNATPQYPSTKHIRLFLPKSSYILNLSTDSATPRAKLLATGDKHRQLERVDLRGCCNDPTTTLGMLGDGWTNVWMRDVMMIIIIKRISCWRFCLFFYCLFVVVLEGDGVWRAAETLGQWSGEGFFVVTVSGRMGFVTRGQKKKVEGRRWVKKVSLKSYNNWAF